MKIADVLAQTAERVRTVGASNPAALSNAIVHVRADGAIEVSIHARVVIGAGESADLRRLGAEVVTTVTTPAVAGVPATSVVQAWVPAGQLAAIAALDWVAAVTAPAYGQAGG